MKDNLGREINYLRISVTQRCNLSCVYCGSEKPCVDEMTPDEIERIVKIFALYGINKVRITGGEPLVRDDIAKIVSKIKKISGIEKIVLTTNGVRLFEYASALKKAGVSAVNVSLDSLDRENYKSLTGTDALQKVLDGIERAEQCSLKVRINSVLIRGKNEKEAGALIALAKDRNIDVRFIELMPFSKETDNEGLIIKGREILEKFSFLKPVETKKEQSVAKYYEADGYKGRIGLITPVSENFCSSCNRIRLLSDGKLRPCLGHEETFDLREYFDDEEKMSQIIKQAVLSKPTGHEFSCGYGKTHAMNKIGG